MSNEEKNQFEESQHTETEEHQEQVWQGDSPQSVVEVEPEENTEDMPTVDNDPTIN
jgi:hypothetical protein